MSARTPQWWRWPNGALWRRALRAGAQLRRRRFESFMRIVAPAGGDRVLDVGVSLDPHGTGNHFLRWYPWPARVTACGLEGEPEICRQRKIRYVRADGRRLPFDDDAFEVAHCNAVVEHAGPGARQRKLVAELVRVAGRVWLTTPDAAGPFEPHTLLPLAHWLPTKARHALYRAAGRGYFADPDRLNPLDAGRLRRLFPARWRRNVAIRRQYFCGVPVILIAYLDRRESKGAER